MTEKELIEYWQQKKAELPAERPAMWSKEEAMCKIITYLAYYHNRSEDFNTLMKCSMIITKGHASPAWVKEAVEAWKEAT